MNENQKIKEKGLLYKIWNDQVFSQIISVILLSLLTVLYSFFQSIFSDISFKEALINALTFKIELYKLLIFISLTVIFLIIIYKIRKKRNKKIGRFDVEQKVGLFSFRELYNALLTHKIKTPSGLLEHGAEETSELLKLFIFYQQNLNIGVQWDHDHYTYYTLGPALMSYGLTEKVPTTNKLDSVGSEMIQTSQIGYEFYSLIEKWRVYNDEILNDANIEIEDNKKD